MSANLRSTAKSKENNNSDMLSTGVNAGSDQSKKAAGQRKAVMAKAGAATCPAMTELASTHPKKGNAETIFEVPITER